VGLRHLHQPAGWFFIFWIMKTIDLPQGKVALVSDEDYEELAQYSWRLSGKGYAMTYSDGAALTMHRLLLGAKKGEEVDHINGDPLDNRRENLRKCTHAENMKNRKMHANNKLGVKGVYWDVQRTSFRAQIKVDGRKIHLGLFDSVDDASKAYQKASKFYFGEFARAA
jgi:hypothetical protein